jgi:hypothetical protein
MAISRLMPTWSQTEDLKPGQPRLLESDNRIVVPVGDGCPRSGNGR